MSRVENAIKWEDISLKGKIHKGQCKLEGGPQDHAYFWD